MTGKASPDPEVWAPQPSNAFNNAEGPLLSPPTSDLPITPCLFPLFVHERESRALRMSSQKHDGHRRPLGYYSLALDPGAKAHPPVSHGYNH